MTRFFATVSAPPQDGRAPVARWVVISAAMVLTACSSTPLPPWPSGTTASSPSPVTSGIPSPSPAKPQAVVSISPITPTTALEPRLYSDAVAALFPAPAARYDTPGLAEGRRSFTTNTELDARLRELSQKSLGLSPRLGLLNHGQAQSGTPLLALVATKGAAINPAALDSTGHPTVLVVAGQQGNAPASTEALLVLIQELDQGGLLTGLLDHINIVLVPRANPDGFEQGTAPTADGTDLRHDHLQLHTPEARFLAKLASDYRPAVVIDAGEFPAIEPTLQRFGGLRAEDMGLQYAVTPNAHEFVTKAARTWLHDAMVHALSQAQQRVDWVFAPAGTQATNGFAMDTVQPTTLANASALKHAASITALSRGQDLGRMHAQRRVHSHVTAISAALQATAGRARELKEIQAFAAREVASQSCQKSITLQAQPRLEQREVQLIDPQSAQLAPQRAAWASSLELVSPQTRANACGYWLSRNAVQAAQRLALLGLNVQRVAETAPLPADTYQAAAEVNAGSNQRATSVTLAHASVEATAGSYYVSMNQPLAHVAVAALEPDSPYSYYRTGILPKLADVARVIGANNLVFEDE